ncbi:MAG: glutathione S-transferase family protein [Chakrabartia godavariana]
MIQIFGHPFSSYTWKALIALREKDVPFEFRILGPDHPDNGAEFAQRWPIGKFPLLVDGGRQVMEATSIIEYLDVAFPQSARLLPDDPQCAQQVRMLDRIFDNYVMTPVQRIVGNALLPEERRDAATVTEAEAALEQAYGWLDAHMAGRGWAEGADFSLADCAAAPSLFYADWVHPITAQWPSLAAYRARLVARASVARAIDEARPYRPLFPLGAPDRD